jgi:hypothetical protein
MFSRVEEVTNIAKNMSLENRPKRPLIEADGNQDASMSTGTRVDNQEEVPAKRRRLEIPVIQDKSGRQSPAWSETSSIRSQSPPPTVDDTRFLPGAPECDVSVQTRPSSPISDNLFQRTSTSPRSPTPLPRKQQSISPASSIRPESSALSPVSTTSSLPSLRKQSLVASSRNAPEEDGHDDGAASSDDEPSSSRTRSKLKMPESSPDGEGEDEIDEQTFLEVDVVPKAKKKAGARSKGGRSGGNDAKGGSKPAKSGSKRGENVIRSLIGQVSCLGYLRSL